MTWLTTAALSRMRFRALGDNVLLSDKCSIYNAGNISIGSNVRIDDFVVLSAGEGGISIGNSIHVAVFCSLIGAGRITLSDFCNLSSRVSIYSSNDDYSGAHMTNPMVPVEFTGVDRRDVFLGKHVIVGAGSVILPGVRIEEGVAIGALSLVAKSCEAFGVFGGIPARRLKSRERGLLDKEQDLRRSIPR